MTLKLVTLGRCSDDARCKSIPCAHVLCLRLFVKLTCPANVKCHQTCKHNDRLWRISARFRSLRSVSQVAGAGLLLLPYYCKQEHSAGCRML